jgi:phosphatidate phosphatase APP1
MPAKSLTSLIHKLEFQFDRLKSMIPGRAPVHIQVYFCLGTPRKIFMKGRVLENKRILPVTNRDRFWINLFNAFQRYESDEVPFAQLRMFYAGQEQFVTANDEGYFDAWLFLPELSGDELAALRVRLELLEPVRPGQFQPVTETHPTIIPADCRLGVISDIDDTVIRTDVLMPLKMLVNIFFKSARSRQAFPGTAAFYRALSAGRDGQGHNPIFYASTSPWNLFDLLVGYFNYRGFPPDPILYLRDWGITENEILPVDNFDHKKLFIQIVLELFSEIRVIFIGDSGQQDPEIYAGVAEANPGRILAIYLREVTGNPQRIESIHRVRARLARRGVPVILANNVLPMAEHAAREGWISPEQTSQIRSQVQSTTTLLRL